MDLEAIWTEHKSFILSVGLGLAVFAVFAQIAGQFEVEAATARSENEKEERRLDGLRERVQGQEGFQKGVERAIDREVAPAVWAAMALRREDRYRLEGDLNPEVFFSQRRRDTIEALRARDARGVSSAVPDFGIPDRVPRERIDERLALLDFTRRVVAILFDAGATRLTRVSWGDTSYDAAPVGDRPFVRWLSLSVAFEGDAGTVAYLVSHLEGDGELIAVSGLEVAKGEGDAGAVRASADLLALERVSELPADATAGADDGRRTGRDPRSRYRRPGARDR